MQSDMKLALMTRPTFFVEEDKIIDTLFDEGLDDLHIFKPSSSPIYVERLLSLLSDDYYRYITVHHHFYLKQEFGLRGIHLEQADTERPDGYKGNFSRSCSDLSMLQQSKKKSRYVFLHNIFDSISEPSLTRTFSSEQLLTASRQGLIDKHVYALGGVTAEHVRMLGDLGLGGVVICGDLWSRFDIHNGSDFKNVINYFIQLRQACGY